MTSPTSPTDLPRRLRFIADVPGFPGHRDFMLRSLEETGTILELHSTVDENVRLVVVPSVAFFPDYAPEIDEATAADLRLTQDNADVADALLLLVVTVGASLAESTANLLAPVIVNISDGQAVQAILEDPVRYPVKAPLAAGRG